MPQMRTQERIGCNYNWASFLNKVFIIILLILLLLLLLLELLGETRIIRIILLLIIISAGTPFVSNSFHLSWNPKYIEFWDQYILVSS